MSFRTWLGASGMMLLLAIVACTAQPGRQVMPEAESTAGVDPPPAAFLHPPYDSLGRGTLSGELVGLATRTYPAGSLQKPIPLPVAIVRWQHNGQSRESEFILDHVSNLVVDGRSIIETATEDAVVLVPAALRQAGTGSHVEVQYAGSGLSPAVYITPDAQRDYPYALAQTVVVTR